MSICSSMWKKTSNHFEYKCICSEFHQMLSAQILQLRYLRWLLDFYHSCNEQNEVSYSRKTSIRSPMPSTKSSNSFPPTSPAASSISSLIFIPPKAMLQKYVNFIGHKRYSQPKFNFDRFEGEEAKTTWNYIC